MFVICLLSESTAGSTTTLDSPLFPSNTNNSRSNSPADSDISTVSSIEELMSSLSLNQSAGPMLNNANNSPQNFLSCSSELELTNLQNLQAIHALKYLQQPPAVFSSLLQNPACSHYNSQVTYNLKLIECHIDFDIIPTGYYT